MAWREWASAHSGVSSRRVRSRSGSTRIENRAAARASGKIASPSRTMSPHQPSIVLRVNASATPATYFAWTARRAWWSPRSASRSRP